MLLCTSVSEGFPNVFLEAWSCCRGVLSTVDPDGVITRFRTGAVAADYDAMRHQVVRLDERQAFWEAAGLRGRQYVESHHTVHVGGEALAKVIADVLRRQ